MSDKTYNGWSNYETWCVKLWMNNEEPSYRYWLERTESVIEDADKTDSDWKQDAVNSLREELKSEHEEALPEVHGFAADLLNAAMGEVDWYEIAESMIDDYVALRTLKF